MTIKEKAEKAARVENTTGPRPRQIKASTDIKVKAEKNKAEARLPSKSKRSLNLRRRCNLSPELVEVRSIRAIPLSLHIGLSATVWTTAQLPDALNVPCGVSILVDGAHSMNITISVLCLVHVFGEPVDKELWGELEPEEAPADRLQALSGLETPSDMTSVVSTVAGGLETPNSNGCSKIIKFTYFRLFLPEAM
ncbi:hypothetical protein JOM56_013741 [Amanita muscaria]